MDEVDKDVRSRKSYIKEYSDEEDAEKAFDEILEEKVQITNAETDQFNKVLDDELDNLDENSNKGIVGDD